MQSRMHRTSMLFGKPWEEAYKKVFIKTDANGVKYKDELWVIRIDTLEELIDLTNKYGNLMISNVYSPDELNSIEIYDSYRE